MRKSTPKPCRKKAPKRVLALPDLEQSKAAVLNSLTSASGQRTYDHAIREFVAWYCSEPRLAFNRTVVLRYRIHLEQRGTGAGDVLDRRGAYEACSHLHQPAASKARRSTASTSASTSFGAAIATTY